MKVVKRKKYLVAGVFLILLAGSGLWVTVTLEKPPLAEINTARQRLAGARLARLSGFESELLHKASLHFDSAMILWNRENERFFLFRDYGEVRFHADRAGTLAGESVSQTREMIRDAGKELRIRIPSVEDKLAYFQDRYGQFPYEKRDMEELTRARLLFNEGEIAHRMDDLPTSKQKMDQAEAILAQLMERYQRIEAGYFRSYGQWNLWVEETVEKSRKEKVPCIVIDKYARSCHLYKNGKLQKTYAAELGPNWIGDKTLQGDRSTPEGQYRVVSKKAKGQTKYHKAFLLDYPNQDDRARFQQNKRNGTLHSEAKIGSFIEIHGSGGKGADWTDGCIALNNKDMDELYAACETGTRVTIVGSVVPLETINERYNQSFR